MSIQCIQTYFEEHFRAFEKPVSEISKSHNSTEPRVNSDIAMYNFDGISATISPKPGFRSADALRFRRKRIELIEFKSGFSRMITRENWDPKQCLCPNDEQTECIPYKDKFLRIAELELHELRDSIKYKALESYVTLDKLILPRFSLGTHIAIDYIVVIDGNSNDQYESILADAAQMHNQKSNQIASLKSSLSRFVGCKDANGSPYYYDRIFVYTFQEYQRMLDREK